MALMHKFAIVPKDSNVTIISSDMDAIPIFDETLTTKQNSSVGGYMVKK